MDQLSDFLHYARDRITNEVDDLPCAPEDAAAVMGYLCALVPEYELDQQEDAADNQARQTDRKRAIVDGLRRARGAKPTTSSPTTSTAANNTSDNAGPESA
jgi:hypothetical protein